MQSSPFKTSFAENIFRHKYAQGADDTWAALAERLVDDVCGTMGGEMEPLLPEDTLSELVKLITEMKFIPGGRYLYYAGRPLHAWNNCLAGHHKVLTDKGMVRLDELTDGQPIKVYSPVSNLYEDAVAKSHGVQPVQEIVFENLRGRSHKQWKVVATRNHHWPLIGGDETYDIRVGDVVPAASVFFIDNKQAFDAAFQHGLVFADGTLHRQAASGLYEHQLRLCGAKYVHAERFQEHSITHPPFAGGDPCVYIKSEINLKELPVTEDPSYVAGFVQGWLAGDGHHGETRQLHSVRLDAIEWFVEHAHLGGYIVTGEILVETKPSNFGERQPLYRVNFKDADDFAGFKVVEIQPFGKMEVFCPFEPKYNRIVIDHGIDTYQCYLLKGEEDTREEWGNLLKRASDCLMTGGGIGVDYSVFRPEGAVLARTGGTSSGPLPLMQSVNEHGRNVKQGGSRRSAIYASLNWRHGDIMRFLRIKNWHDMPVGKQKKRNGEPYTLWDAKQEDFNFPAPLDMTNVSVNYDDEFLRSIADHGVSGTPVFFENVKQALSTGEPGFSFNFGDKQNETLRNACTEVCSADDSDVCNLGSLNMGAFDNFADFDQAVSLASQFLVCGTLRADLPYEKIHQVREKNRRLGLGLMGIHEWLLKRGKPYEVDEDLKLWLDGYRDLSRLSADALCDRLGISRPVAYRAIAPTGTIGILASTTTGIEPLYAVAFKRRYLAQGRWNYEYVVDATADHLIKTYGLKPEDIETAASLAADPERRIKFQADVQDYVDKSISSTINLPSWGTELNNEDKVLPFAKTLAKYAPRLRGFTCYPDGARGGQPLTEVPYEEAVKHRGVVFAENDICSISGKGGSCGL